MERVGQNMFLPNLRNLVINFSRNPFSKADSNLKRGNKNMCNSKDLFMILSEALIIQRRKQTKKY